MDIVVRAKRALASRRRHPFDVNYGVDTSGTVSPRKIKGGAERLQAVNIGYIGAQPSVLRQCLKSLPDLTAATFMDLGCGKGRACIVASEFPFGRIIGLEIGPSLAQVARRNVARIAAKHPARPAIDIRVADASAPELPEGLTVLFLYNPFRAPLVGRLLGSLQPQLGLGRKVFVVYYNPVHHQLFDDCNRFVRYSAEKIRFDRPEAAVAAWDNTFDSVVIYQSADDPMYPGLEGSSRQVRITVPDLGADVED